MGMSDLYTANRIMNNPQWLGLKTRQDYFENFAVSHASSVTANYQVARNHFYTLATSKFANITQALNFETKFSRKGKDQGIHVSVSSQIQGWIDSIRNAKLDNYKKSGDTTGMITVAQGEALLAKWTQLQQLVAARNWDHLETEMENLNSYIDNLHNQLSTGAGLIDFAQVLEVSDPTKKNAYSLASRLEGLLSRIQGEALEQEIIKMIQEKMPESISTNVTGSITSVSGTKIKPDLIAILNGVSLLNEFGQKTYTFKDGDIVDADGLPATRTITLTDAEVNSLFDKAAGFSAKTTGGQPTFHQGYNIRALLDEALQDGEASMYQLYHFYQLGLTGLTNGEVDPYQRYAVSKIAIKILGENNVYLVSQKEIIPTYQYIDKIMKKGFFFSNKNIPVRTGDSFNTDFGSTNIMGPKV